MTEDERLTKPMNASLDEQVNNEASMISRNKNGAPGLQSQEGLDEEAYRAMTPLKVYTTTRKIFGLGDGEPLKFNSKDPQAVAEEVNHQLDKFVAAKTEGTMISAGNIGGAFVDWSAGLPIVKKLIYDTNNNRFEAVVPEDSILLAESLGKISRLAPDVASNPVSAAIPIIAVTSPPAAVDLSEQKARTPSTSDPASIPLVQVQPPAPTEGLEQLVFASSLASTFAPIAGQAVAADEPTIGDSSETGKKENLPYLRNIFRRRTKGILKPTEEPADKDDPAPPARKKYFAAKLAAGIVLAGMAASYLALGWGSFNNKIENPFFAQKGSSAVSEPVKPSINESIPPLHSNEPVKPMVLDLKATLGDAYINEKTLNELTDKDILAAGHRTGRTGIGYLLTGKLLSERELYDLGIMEDLAKIGGVSHVIIEYASDGTRSVKINDEFSVESALRILPALRSRLRLVETSASYKTQTRTPDRVSGAIEHGYGLASPPLESLVEKSDVRYTEDRGIKRSFDSTSHIVNTQSQTYNLGPKNAERSKQAAYRDGLIEAFAQGGHFGTTYQRNGKLYVKHDHEAQQRFIDEHGLGITLSTMNKKVRKFKKLYA